MRPSNIGKEAIYCLVWSKPFALQHFGIVLAAAAAGQKGRDHSAGSEEWCSGSEADDSSDDEGTEGYKKGTQPGVDETALLCGTSRRHT